MSASDVCNIVMPEGWNISWDGNVLAFIAESRQVDVNQGSSLGGLGFNSSYAPKMVDFVLRGSDALITIDPPIPNSGPTGVPAPATPLLVGLALLAAAVATRRRPA